MFRLNMIDYRCMWKLPVHIQHGKNKNRLMIHQPVFVLMKRSALANKHLAPVISALDVANSHLGIVCIEDICPVPGGIHPGIYHVFGGCIAHCDIFTSCSISDAKGFHHIKWRAVCRAGVAEISVILHVLRLSLRYVG